MRSIWTSKASRAATLPLPFSKLTLAILLGTAGPEGPTSAAVNKFSGGGGTRRPRQMASRRQQVPPRAKRSPPPEKGRDDADSPLYAYATYPAADNR